MKPDYDKAQKEYQQALEAAWQQRQASLKLGANYNDVSATYLAAIEVANVEYRKIVPWLKRWEAALALHRSCQRRVP